MLLNDEILASNHTSWDDWCRFKPSWYHKRSHKYFRNKAKKALTEEFAQTEFPLIKDPRMCRLMPFWASVFEEMEWTPRFLLPVRFPFEVALSLNRRDGAAGLEQGCMLWLRHVLDAEAETRNWLRSFVDWDSFLKDWQSALTHACGQIDVDLPAWNAHGFEQVDEFLSSSLRHHQTADLSDFDSPMKDWLFSTFSALRELVSNPSSEKALHELDDVRESFEIAANVFEPRPRKCGYRQADRRFVSEKTFGFRMLQMLRT